MMNKLKNILVGYWRSITDPNGSTSIDGNIYMMYGVPIYKNGEVDGASIYAAMKKKRQHSREVETSQTSPCKGEEVS